MQVVEFDPKSFVWPESDLSMEEAREIHQEIDELTIGLFSKDVSVSEYNEKCKVLLMKIEKNSLNFGTDFELFKNFLLAFYENKESAVESAMHEKEHANFLVKNGVGSYSFRLTIYSDGKVQPHVHYTRELNPKEAEHKEFHKNFLVAPEGPSESDVKSACLWEKS